MRPHSPERRFASPADLAACRLMIRGGSKSFHLASLLLPKRVREPARALYAFCRVADDAVDKNPGGGAAVAMLGERLTRIYDGRPDDHPADRAFAEVAHRFAIPRALPEALIEGFAWDAAGRQYDDIAGVRAYSARVAGTVGAMMTLIMGVRDPHAIARALDLGIAMQLTNIARDIGEDAHLGRLYLPRAWLRAEGVDPDTWLSAPAMIPGIGRAVARLLVEADALYMRANAGIAMLPRPCRWSIAAARKLYAEIGHEVARRGFDSVSSRAVVSKRHKLRLVASAIAVSSIRTGSAHAPSLPEAQFLVDAVTATPLPHPRPRGLTARAIWVVDLFARLKEHKS